MFAIRLSPEEIELVKRAAAVNSLSVSQFIRDAIESAAFDCLEPEDRAMPTRDEILEKETHKGLDVERRVYYTLHAAGNKELQAHRTRKAIALLVKHLHQQAGPGGLSVDAIDEILLDCVSA